MIEASGEASGGLKLGVKAQTCLDGTSEICANTMRNNCWIIGANVLSYISSK